MKHPFIMLVLFIVLLSSCNKKAGHDHDHNDSSHQHDENVPHSHDEHSPAQTEFVVDGTETTIDTIAPPPHDHSPGGHNL